MRQMMKISDAFTEDQMFLRPNNRRLRRPEGIQGDHFGIRCICNDGYISGRPGSIHNIFSST